MSSITQNDVIELDNRDDSPAIRVFSDEWSMKQAVPSSLHRERLSLDKCKSLSPIEAREVAAFFKVLASDTRLRILPALIQSDGLCVIGLAASIGMKPQTVSNQIHSLVGQAFYLMEAAGRSGRQRGGSH